MKKKIIPLVISFSCAGLLLGGCDMFGGGDGDQNQKPDVVETTATSEESEGDVIEKDGVRKEVIYTDNNTGVHDETGPMEYSIDSIQLANVITTTDNASRLLDLEKNTDAVMITVSFSCKNNGDITSNFYISQALVETDDGIEATPKSLYGEYMDGNFTAGVSKKGSNVYIIKGKTADEIKSFSFHVDAPANMDFKDIGDDVDLEFEIK